MKRIKRTSILLALSILITQCGPSEQSHLDTGLPVEQRVEILLSKMTLEEKVAQVCSRNRRLSAAIEEGFIQAGNDIKEMTKHGIGQVDNTFDPAKPKESIVIANKIQQYLRDSTRLGIPAIIGSECLHGHAGYNSTIFPSPIAMACSWNPVLVNKVYDVIGREARARGSHEAHTPVLDLGRDPRWGRIEETYGEDTYLTSRMAVAAVSGLQGGKSGNPGTTHIISSSKHFAGYGQVAGGRNFAPTPLSHRTLHDEILPPFEAAIKEAKGQGIMASHCDIDGIPAHGNPWLLTELLKEKWGFEGYVVSDYMDIKRLEGFHHVAKDTEEAAKLALTAGMDMDLPVGAAYKTLVELINKEPELENYLNESVRRVLRLKFMLGLFEDPFTDVDEGVKYVGNENNVALSEQMAIESIVLLQNNNNTLPLDIATIKSIAVLGPNADSEETGVYSAKSDHIISILKGLEKTIGDQVEIRHAEGCKIALFPNGEYDSTIMNTLPLEQELPSIQQAVALANASDVAIVVVGGMMQTSREAIFKRTHLGDRSTIGLLGNQQELIKRVAATGKPTIVVLMGGKPYAIPEVTKTADAILSTFYLGQQNGIAVSKILFGQANPSGKLCVSFPRSVGQLPVYYSQKETAFFKNYLDESSRPLFAFGHGLSYTQFEFSALEIPEKAYLSEDSLEISCKVKNTGALAGAEVVQLYYRDLVASITRPGKLLVRFEKVFLQPGEEKTVRFVIHPHKDLSFTGPGYKRVVEPGDFEIYIGNSSDNILLEGKFELE